MERSLTSLPNERSFSPPNWRRRHKILELSGVGRHETLRSVGLHALVESEKVGEQLVDHPWTVLSYDLVDGEVSLDHMTQEAVIGEAIQVYGRGTGGKIVRWRTRSVQMHSFQSHRQRRRKKMSRMKMTR